MENQPLHEQTDADRDGVPAPESPSLFRLIFNQTGSSIILIDKDLRVIEANEYSRNKARKLLQRELTPGMSILELTPPDRIDDFLSVYAAVFNGETKKLNNVLPVDGANITFEIEIKPLYNASGDLIAAMITSKDISENLKAETLLKEAEERWRFALEGANQGAWDWNLKTGEVFYSESYKKLHGYTSDDLIENINEWKSRIHPDDLHMIETALSQHISGPHPFYDTRYRIKDVDGSYKWIMARGMIMGKDDQGKPLRMIGTHTDITEQVRAEQHYKSLFQFNPLPCWIYVTGKGKFLEVNEAAVKQYGYSEKEILEGNLFLMHPSWQFEKLKERLANETTLNNHSINNWIHKKKNGEIIYVDLRITNINYNGIDAKLVVAHDVTTKVQTEKDLRTSNQRFELAAKATLEALWEWNIEADELYLSPVYEEMFGYSVSAERKYRQWHEYIHPEDMPEVTVSFYDALRIPSITKWQKEYRYLKADGTYMDVVDHCIILRNETGKAIKVVGAYQDISERKHAEQELIISNERFLHAAKASSEALWEWDFISGQFFASQAYTDIFGWKVNEQRTFDEWHDYIHSEDREETISSYYGALDNPSIQYWKKEYRYLKTDGNYAHVIDKASILRDKTGRPVKVIGAIQDISDQKKAEEDLRKSNDRFQLVNRATSDAIYDWDIITNELYWGEGIQSLFGFVPQEVSFERWESLVHPADRQRVHDSLFHTIAQNNTSLWKEEYRFSTAGGGYRYVLERGFIMRDEKGKAVRLIGSIQDITDRHYQEQMLSLEKTIFELSTNPRLEFKYIILTLLKGIEEIHEDAYTSVMLLTESETMMPLAAPRLPAAFSDPLTGTKIGATVGSCGAAMANKERVIVEDISTHPHWKDHKEHALKFGLKACWALPITHSNGDVMGSFTIFYKKPKGPTPGEINTFERVRNIIRVLMENNWSINRIKEAKERFDIMMRATHDLIWDWNLETNTIYRDQLGLQNVYGINSNDSIRLFPRWLQRIHPDDRERVGAVIGQILKSKQQNHFDVEYRFRRNDNSYTNVYDRGIIVRNSEGRAIRMIGAAQDVTERKRLEQELLQNELEKQKAINQATVDTQEAERSEIGKELHDNVNQVLTTTKLYLDLALSSPELKDELIEKSNRNIINVINEIRQLSRSLMDPSIDDLGLIDSIHDLVENINLTRKLHVKLVTDKKIETLLDKNHKLTVFRIIQEALNNAIRHAKATTVLIKFTHPKNDIEIVIEDDGIGFEPSSVKKGAGLKNIQNRIYLINGSHNIQSAPGKGCRIIIRFPIIKQPLELPI